MRKKADQTVSERISRGMAAQRERTMMDEAFAVYAEQLFQQWLMTEPNDVTKREEIHATVRAIAGAKAVLTTIINAGVLAEQEAHFEHLLRPTN